MLILYSCDSKQGTLKCRLGKTNMYRFRFFVSKFPPTTLHCEEVSQSFTAIENFLKTEILPHNVAVTPPSHYIVVADLSLEPQNPHSLATQLRLQIAGGASIATTPKKSFTLFRKCHHVEARSVFVESCPKDSTSNSKRSKSRRAKLRRSIIDYPSPKQLARLQKVVRDTFNDTQQTIQSITEANSEIEFRADIPTPNLVDNMKKFAEIAAARGVKLDVRLQLDVLAGLTIVETDPFYEDILKGCDNKFSQPVNTFAALGCQACVTSAYTANLSSLKEDKNSWEPFVIAFSMCACVCKGEINDSVEGYQY